jgi:hypothetical protein
MGRNTVCAVGCDERGSARLRWRKRWCSHASHDVITLRLARHVALSASHGEHLVAESFCRQIRPARFRQLIYVLWERGPHATHVRAFKKVYRP